MGKIIVTPKAETKVWMEEQEVCREYYKTEKITFGMSELAPGAVGAVDPGHSEAHEVFFCVQGEVLCYVSQDDKYYRLCAHPYNIFCRIMGDAVLVMRVLHERMDLKGRL